MAPGPEQLRQQTRSSPSQAGRNAHPNYDIDHAAALIIQQRPTNNPFRSGLEIAMLDCPSAGFAEFVRWLDDHTPGSGPDVICHGDLHPLNVLIDDRGSTWLLDGTTATIAPKEMDIGLTAGLLRCAPIVVRNCYAQSSSGSRNASPNPSSTRSEQPLQSTAMPSTGGKHCSTDGASQSCPRATPQRWRCRSRACVRNVRRRDAPASSAAHRCHAHTTATVSAEPGSSDDGR